MIHRLGSYKIFEESTIYNVSLDGDLEHGDIVIIDMGGDTVAAIAGPPSFLCYDCPFVKNRRCTVCNDRTNKILCSRSDGTYVGFEPLDNILENL